VSAARRRGWRGGFRRDTQRAPYLTGRPGCTLPARSGERRAVPHSRATHGTAFWRGTVMQRTVRPGQVLRISHMTWSTGTGACAC
jgi:hypothetical protein